MAGPAHHVVMDTGSRGCHGHPPFQVVFFLEAGRVEVFSNQERRHEACRNSSFYNESVTFDDLHKHRGAVAGAQISGCSYRALSNIKGHLQKA